MGTEFSAERGETNSTNWIDGPHNRWGFLHVRDVARTVRIGGSREAVEPLPRRHHDISGFAFDHLERRWTIGEMLDETYTDGLMVVHDGAVLLEHYGGLMRPTDTHLLMSVSKSLTATLAGVLVGEGVIDTAGFVPDYIPSLRGTSWEGCTLQHLLDMRAGTKFDEDDYDNPESDGRLIEQVSGYTARTRSDLPADTYEWIRRVANASDHGGPFQYRSILPDVLAWVMCEATGATFADLFSRHIWSQIAANDAEIIIDPAGFPVVEGGICTTLEDLARFGVMCLQRGAFGGRQIVPSDMDAQTDHVQRGVDLRLRAAAAGWAGGAELLLSRLLVGVRQRGRRLLRPRDQRPDAHDPPSFQHGDRQVLDVAGPDGLRPRRPDRRRSAGSLRFFL